MKRVAKLILLNVLLLLALVEVLPRLVPIPGLTRAELDPPQVRSAETRRTGPHPYMSYALKPGWRSAQDQRKVASHNQLGFRGPELERPKPAGTFRVLCLGGSSTYGSGPTSNERTYPARLQHHLRAGGTSGAEVVNMGAPGWTSTETMINLCLRGVELEPDLVIVYHANNDAHAALWPEPTWDQTHFRATWTDVRESSLERLLERSRAYLIWRAYLTDHLDQRLAQDFYTIAHYDASYTEPDLERPIPERGVLTFRRNLGLIVAVARAQGAQVVFATQAFHPSEGRGAHPHSGAVRKRAIGVMLAAQADVAQELAVPLIESAAVIENATRAELEQDGKQSMFTNNVHLRNRGANLLASTIAEELFARGLVPSH